MDLEELVYEWPPQVAGYEPKILAGLTWTEGISVAMGFLIPLALFQGQGVIGFVFAVLGGVGALLVMKRFERLGGVSIPLYLIYRLQAWYKQESLELSLIVPHDVSSGVIVENLEGEVVTVLE